MRLATAAVLLLLAVPAAADDETPLVQELFLTEAPWTQGRGEIQLSGAWTHQDGLDVVVGFAEYGVTDRVQISLEGRHAFLDGDGDSELEIGGTWAVRADPGATTFAVGATLAQLHEDASLTFLASIGHPVGPGVGVADVRVPLGDVEDVSAHAGYVHPLGAFRLLAEGEVVFADDADFALAPGVAWKPSEAFELGAALVLPLQDGADKGVVVQATVEF